MNRLERLELKKSEARSYENKINDLKVKLNKYLEKEEENFKDVIFSLGTIASLHEKKVIDSLEKQRLTVISGLNDEIQMYTGNLCVVSYKIKRLEFEIEHINAKVAIIEKQIAEYEEQLDKIPWRRGQGNNQLVRDLIEDKIAELQNKIKEIKGE